MYISKFNRISLCVLSALFLDVGPAHAESWCPAGLHCADDEIPTFCREGYYCEASFSSTEKPCDSPWSCPEGSKTRRGIGIRDYVPNIYGFETAKIDISVISANSEPAFVPATSDALRRGTRLRSGRNSDLCLSMDQAKDLARASLRTCDDSLEQIFYMDSSGKIRTRKSDKMCLEMDPSSESWGGVFVHSACLDRWEILGNGALKNVGDNKCLGVRSSIVGTIAERLNCGTLQLPYTIWGNVEPQSAANQKQFKYDHCTGFDFPSCVYNDLQTNPSKISNDYGFLNESAGQGKSIGLAESDFLHIPRDGVWDFEISKCPTQATLQDTKAGTLPPTCYLIVNRHSGRFLFATSGMEGTEGLGVDMHSGDSISDDMKWIIVEDDTCETQYCFEIVNAQSGRKLHSMDNLYTLPNVGASTNPLNDDNSYKWRVLRDQLSLGEWQKSKLLMDQQEISCIENGGVLTSFKMQTTNSEMNYSFGCDDAFSAGLEAEVPIEMRSNRPSVIEGGKWECLQPGHVLSGISTKHALNDAWSALSTCTDIGANTDVCDDFTTAAVPLYLDGRRSPNPIAHLSKLPVECLVGQALRSVSLENDGSSARYLYRCCEIIKNDLNPTPQQRALDKVTTVTNSISACGARHAWILPGHIVEDNTKYDPAKFSDRISVLINRLNSVIAGMESGFRLGGITDTLMEEREKLSSASNIMEAIQIAEFISSIVSAKCPSEPVFRWKRAASGTSIETQLEFGLTSEWSEGEFEEFVEGVTESRGQLHGQEVSSGKESTTGSSTTITDTFSVTATVGADYGFASASLELGYERSEEQSSFQEETSSSSETQTMELTTDISQDVSKSLGREVVTTSSISETRTCTAKCRSEDDNQVVIWQWVHEQTDPNAKAATVHTCTFVCRSSIFDTPPVCPGGQCLNNDCTICKEGTFSDPAIDILFSSEREASAAFLFTAGALCQILVALTVLVNVLS